MQFETIHPFMDGNGRIGRLLIPLILVEAKVISEPLLYLSVFFKKHRQTYYERLNQVRLTGDWEGWLLFFVDAVAAMANQALMIAQQLNELRQSDRKRLNDLGRMTGSANQILDALTAADFGNVDMRRIEFVGPNVGAELAENGGIAIIIALICIMLYVSMRFEWRLATGSVLALAHDIIITLGVFSLFQIEFDLTVLAALLAVVGYSLNDTIVVFDRIRENFRSMPALTPEEIVDKSLTQTLSRTIITSGTTIFVLVSLFVVGGELIHGFATALLIGIFVGTYSSIYVASALAIRLGVQRDHMIPEVIEKEGADQDPLM